MEHQLFRPHFNTQVRRRQTRLYLHFFFLSAINLWCSAVLLLHCGWNCLNAAPEAGQPRGTALLQPVNSYLSQSCCLESVCVLIQQKAASAAPQLPSRGWAGLCRDAPAPTGPHDDRLACFPNNCSSLIYNWTYRRLYFLSSSQGCRSGLTICSCFVLRVIKNPLSTVESVCSTN